jgi:hypothetical protein
MSDIAVDGSTRGRWRAIHYYHVLREGPAQLQYCQPGLLRAATKIRIAETSIYTYSTADRLYNNHPVQSLSATFPCRFYAEAGSDLLTKRPPWHHDVEGKYLYSVRENEAPLFHVLDVKIR